MPKPKSEPLSSFESPIKVGNNVLIRTVTTYYTGRIVGVDPSEILLVDAAWIASTGRFATSLEKGDLSEVEPYPDGTVVSVSRGAVVDVCGWKHALPRQQK